MQYANTMFLNKNGFNFSITRRYYYPLLKNRDGRKVDLKVDTDITYKL